jgi:hypothetical protein
MIHYAPPQWSPPVVGDRAKPGQDFRDSLAAMEPAGLPRVPASGQVLGDGDHGAAMEPAGRRQGYDRAVRRAVVADVAAMEAPVFGGWRWNRTS